MATFHDVIVFASGRRGRGAKKIVRYEGRGLVLYGEGKLGKTALRKAISAKMGWRYIFTNLLDALRGANIPKGKMGEMGTHLPKKLGGRSKPCRSIPLYVCRSYLVSARLHSVRKYLKVAP